MGFGLPRTDVSNTAAAARVRMSLEVQVAATLVRDVCVQLGRGEVRVAEHLLHAPQVGAAFERVRREGFTEEVRVDAPRLEPRLRRNRPQDEEDPRTGQRSALRVQEELVAVAAVQVRPTAGGVAAERLDGRPTDRDDALLVALADAPDDSL